VTLTVRCATETDAHALAELAARTFPLACPAGTSAQDIADFIASNLTANHFATHLRCPTTRALLALQDDSPVGYALLIAGDDGLPDPGFGVQGPRSAYLSKFYVLASAHGGSVSGPLLAATLEQARELRANSVWLAVNQQNSRAIRFYEKSQFVRVGTKTMQVGNELHADFVYQIVV